MSNSNSQTVRTTDVRLAAPADLLAIPTLALWLREETYWKDVPFTPEPDAVIQGLFRSLYTDPDTVLYIAEDKGVVIGFCLGILVRHPLVPSVPTVYEIGWYVLPEYRPLGVGRKLWESVVQWGRDRGARAASYARPILDGRPNGSGYRLIEHTMWKDLG